MEVSVTVIVGYIMMWVVFIIITLWLDGGKCVSHCRIYHDVGGVYYYNLVAGWR